MGSDGQIDGCVSVPCEGALDSNEMEMVMEVVKAEVEADYLASTGCSHGDGGSLDC